MSRDHQGLVAQHIKLIELIELDNKNAFLALNIAFSLSNSIDSMQSHIEFYNCFINKFETNCDLRVGL